MMNKIIETIQSMRKHFGWDKTDTPEFMVDALIEEAHELKESLNDPENFEKELADVLMYAIALSIDKNIDIETIIQTKAKEVMKREY